MAPAAPLSDVRGWEYTGNRLHPTQKPISLLRPLVESFSSAGAVVMDPFCGSGPALLAARMAGRSWVGIEKDARHCYTASLRVNALATGGLF